MWQRHKTNAAVWLVRRTRQPHLAASVFCQFLPPQIWLWPATKQTHICTDVSEPNQHFFKIKGRSTVTSYKKKKHWYITHRSEHHHHTDNAPNKTLHHYNLGEEAKEAATNCAVVANAVPRRSCGPLQVRAATRTPPPRDYHPQAAHTRPSIPLFQWCFSRTLPSQRR